MASGNAVLTNFSGGETDPKGRGRFDAPWYVTSARKILNFITETLGPARYRPGFVMAWQVKGGQVGRLINFQISNNLGFILEFTPGFMRVGLNGSLVTSTAQTVDNMTQTNPAVIHLASTTGFANGDEVVLSNIGGMPQLNGRQVVLANQSGYTFELQDPVTGLGIDTTGLPAFTSGGSAALIYQLATPYSADDLESLMWAADGANGLMYLTCPTQSPYKLTVNPSGDISIFTLGLFPRVNDPFTTAGRAQALIGVVFSAQTEIVFAPGTVLIPGAPYTFAGVGGTTQLNGGVYYLVPQSTPSGDVVGLLTDVNGNYINAPSNPLSWGAWTSGGTATPYASETENPIGVAFYEGRLAYAGTNLRPACLFFSMSPDSSGNQQYDTFTGGSDADNACFFQLAPVGGSNDYICWARGGPDYFFVGTFGGPFRVSGSGLDIPITPSSINVRQFDTHGCEETMPAGIAEMFFIQRGGTAVRSIKVINPYLATFESDDLTLNAQQIAYSPITRVVLANGKPDILWAIRADGVLCGMSVHITAQAADELTGWHRHEIGGVSARVVDLATLERTTGVDQLWGMTQRTVGGVTRTFAEYMADDVSFPDKEDFFTDDKAADLAAFNGAVYRTQEEYIHLDAASTYDGTARGVAAGATLTPGAVSGTAVTFTASEDVFTAADVGSELWKKPNAQTGLGAGRALITAYTDEQHVTCDIDDDGVEFDSTAAIAAGQWHIAVSTIYGLSYLEGQQVAVVTDGAVYSDGLDTTGVYFPTVTVTNGTITLTENAGMVHVGLPYTGLLQTHNLEMGGRTGPAQSKPRNIAQMFIRFMNSLGVQYGTDPYKMERVEQRSVNAAMDRPAPVFSGIRKLQYSDTWQAEREKHVVVMQRLPLPAIVEFVDVHYSAGDEGEDE